MKNRINATRLEARAPVAAITVAANVVADNDDAAAVAFSPAAPDASMK